MSSRMNRPHAVPPHSSAVVFVNSRAGGFARGGCAEVATAFAELEVPAEFICTKSRQDMESQVREAIASGKKLFFAIGGDGTLQGLVNAAYGFEVTLGILPAGGGNDFAAALGIPRDCVEATRSLLLGEVRTPDLLRVRTAEGQERLYCGGGGVGLDAEAARYASGVWRKAPGKSRYVLSALCALGGFKPLTVRAEFPGTDLEPIERKVLVAAALNAPTYGAGLELAEGARIDDGYLEVVLVEDLRAIEIGTALLHWIRQGKLETRRVVRRTVRRVRFITDRPSNFHGDGEILGPAPVEIDVVPRAIRILAPCRHTDANQ